METADLAKAVCRVLPALNLNPDGFRLDPGFATRAQRSGQPRSVSLNEVAKQFVFLGLRTTAEEGIDIEEFAGDALAVLAPHARAACEGLVVAWTDSSGRAFAAAFVVAAEGESGTLVGASWIAPEDWPEPMIDISKPGDDIIDDALN